MASRFDRSVRRGVTQTVSSTCTGRPRSDPDHRPRAVRVKATRRDRHGHVRTRTLSPTSGTRAHVADAVLGAYRAPRRPALGNVATHRPVPAPPDHRGPRAPGEGARTDDHHPEPQLALRYAGGALGAARAHPRAYGGGGRGGQVLPAGQEGLVVLAVLQR